MSNDTVCEGTCNKTQGSVVTAKVAPQPLYFFRPETGQILECPAESAATVKQEIALLNQLLDDLLTTQATSQQALDQLLQAQKSTDSSAVANAQAAAEQALRKETAAREAMFKEFKDLPKFNDGGNGLMELLPLATRKGDKLHKTRRLTYVRSTKIKSHFRNFHNLPGDAAQMKAFYTKGPDGRAQLDRQKLTQAFSTVPVKSELAKEEVTLWAGGWAPEFVEAFNARNDAKAAAEAAEGPPARCKPAVLRGRFLVEVLRRRRPHQIGGNVDAVHQGSAQGARRGGRKAVDLRPRGYRACSRQHQPQALPADQARVASRAACRQKRQGRQAGVESGLHAPADRLRAECQLRSERRRSGGGWSSSSKPT